MADGSSSRASRAGARPSVCGFRRVPTSGRLQAPHPSRRSPAYDRCGASSSMTTRRSPVRSPICSRPADTRSSSSPRARTRSATSFVNDSTSCSAISPCPTCRAGKWPRRSRRRRPLCPWSSSRDSAWSCRPNNAGPIMWTPSWRSRSRSASSSRWRRASLNNPGGAAAPAPLSDRRAAIPRKRRADGGAREEHGHHDFEREVAEDPVAANRRPRGQPALSIELDEEVDGAVDDPRLLGESGIRVDEAEDLDDPLDPIEITERVLHGSETDEGGIAGGLLPVGDGQVLAEKPLPKGIPVLQGDCSGEVEDVLYRDVGDELGAGRIRSIELLEVGQNETEALQRLFDDRGVL